MQTLFYFHDVGQLNDFASFEVKPFFESHSEAVNKDQKPKFWSVIGTLKKEKSEELQERKVPVADLPSELYAGLFASLCEKLTGQA